MSSNTSEVDLERLQVITIKKSKDELQNMKDEARRRPDKAKIINMQIKKQEEYIDTVNTIFNDLKLFDQHTKERDNAIREEKEFRKKGDTNKADEAAATAHRYLIRLQNNAKGLEKLYKKRDNILKYISSYKAAPLLHTALSTPKTKFRTAKGIKKSPMFTKRHKRKRKSKGKKSKRRRKSKRKKSKKH
tara:strand:- start:1052 stop:1618 length:567 start_codon:yes stop_codon:yes gene_type:complete